MTNRPTWFRLDVDLFDNPKIHRAAHDAGDQAVLLWMRGIAYATRHLTDGWIPLPLPKQWGYTPKHIQPLERHGLWIPLEITDDGGWLINDYAQYQPTRAQWEAVSDRKRVAAKARWADR